MRSWNNSPTPASAAARRIPGAPRRDESLAARGASLPSPKRAEPARLLRCSSVKYGEYSPSSRLAAGPAAPISARSDFHHGLLARLAVGLLVDAGRGSHAGQTVELVLELVAEELRDEGGELG